MVPVPIVVAVPIAIGAPFMPIRIVSGVGFVPAPVPGGVQLGFGLFRLRTVLAVLRGLVPIMLPRPFDAVLALPAAVISSRRHSWQVEKY